MKGLRETERGKENEGIRFLQKEKGMKKKKMKGGGGKMIDLGFYEERK